LVPSKIAEGVQTRERSTKIREDSREYTN